MQKSVVSIA